MTGKYSLKQIAKELTATALGDAYYGNALRVAKDLPGLTDADRALLDRYATGTQSGTDHVCLQVLASQIEYEANHPRRTTEMTEPHEYLSENAGEIIELVADMSAALDNMLLHHGGYMPASDVRPRAALVDKAKRALRHLRPAKRVALIYQDVPEWFRYTYQVEVPDGVNPDTKEGREALIDLVRNGKAESDDVPECLDPVSSIDPVYQVFVMKPRPSTAPSPTSPGSCRPSASQTSMTRTISWRTR